MLRQCVDSSRQPRNRIYWWAVGYIRRDQRVYQSGLPDTPIASVLDTVIVQLISSISSEEVRLGVDLQDDVASVIRVHQNALATFLEIVLVKALLFTQIVVPDPSNFVLIRNV
jgi:hypothetical protein